MVFGGFTYEYENGICKVDPQLFACDVESQVRELLGGRLWGAMWMRLIKVEFILRYSIKYPKLRLQSREDTCFVAATLAKMPKIVRADTVGYHYRIRRSSLIH